mgnify:CR=1 FL=1
MMKVKHGHAKKNGSETYRTWSSMKSRCKYEYINGYENYGGRGVKVCEEWEEFTNFLRDMGERPEGCSIDRIDVNGNYTKENCKWSTNSEQMKNKRPMSPIYCTICKDECRGTSRRGRCHKCNEFQRRNGFERDEEGMRRSKKIFSEGQSKRIHQIDKNNNHVKTWGSVKEASKSMGLKSSAISNCLSGRSKSSAGFKWEYENKNS